MKGAYTYLYLLISMKSASTQFVALALALGVDAAPEWDDEILEDISAECGPWADAFECERNTGYMVKNCLDSCYLHDRVHTAVLSGKPSLVNCNTTVGAFSIELHPSWAPWGVNRFLKLVEDGYFQETFFHNTVPKSHIGFGIGVDGRLVEKWARFAPISDDNPDGRPVSGGGFKRGMVSFLTPSGERHGRTTEVFIALADSDAFGQESWETPVGVVTEGLEHLEAMQFYPAGYGEALRSELAPLAGPERKELLTQHFPGMAKILSCSAHLPTDDMPQEQVEEEEQAQIVVETEAMTHGSPVAAAAARERQERRKRLRREEAAKKRTEERKRRRREEQGLSGFPLEY
jgi:cyclophilin family peptidyl-prolyl cis-trans isomerase